MGKPCIHLNLLERHCRVKAFRTSWYKDITTPGREDDAVNVGLSDPYRRHDIS